jgi:hypothetical protein
MGKASRLFILALPAFLCAVSASAADYPVGIWFGEGEPFDSHVMWQEWFSADGNYHGLYRLCDKGKATDSTQTGRWSISGEQESIQILTVDGMPAPRVDNYIRVSYDGKKWVYRWTGNNYVFTARRVDGKFELPSCESIS